MIEFIKVDSTGAMPYTKGGYVKMVDFVNAWIAVNIGDDTVFINDQPLYPGTATSNGDALSWQGNVGEIYVGIIKIKFEGTGTAPAVAIDQKFYVTNKEQVERKLIK